MDEQEAFIRALHPALVRAAFLLTGQDASAQDLVQETLVRVVLQWRRVTGSDVPEAYVRRVLLNTFLDGRRRSWLRERSWSSPPEQAQHAAYEEVVDRDLLARGLLRLPPRQRAAVVLRHYEDCSEAQTAELMGCSVGTVKSLTSRGLVALRIQLDGAHP